MKRGSTPWSGEWRAHRLAWALVVLVLVANIGAVVFGLLDRDVQSLVATWMFVIATTGFSVVGAAIVTRQAGNTVGWLFLGLALFLSIDHNLAQNSAVYTLVVSPGSLPFPLAVRWLASSALDTVFLLLVVLVLQLFPDGRPLTPRWRPVVAASVAGAVLMTFKSATGTVSDSGPLAGVPNPLSASGTLADVFGVLAAAGVVLLFGGFLAGILAIGLRYRRSHGAERQQVKWIVACALVLSLGTIANVAVANLTGHDSSAVIFALAIIGFPIVVTLAILRYRLYDVDLVIRRTVVYACLAVALAALYLGGIAVLSAGSRLVTGQSGALAVTISTLAVALAFQPLRRRIQGALDRRFDRRTYDAEATVRAFTGHARDEVDIDVLCMQLVAVVETTMQPRHVSMWLQPGAEAPP